MTIILGGYILPVEPVLLSRLPAIKRTQQILMFLISVILFICFTSFMSIIYSLSIKYQTNISGLIIILVWILFFTFGMFVTERYDENGLFVFACLGSINIIFACIFTVYEAVQFVILSTDVSEEITEIHVPIVPIYICMICVILQAIIFILAFKLSYLIVKNQKSMDHEQI